MLPHRYTQWSGLSLPPTLRRYPSDCEDFWAVMGPWTLTLALSMRPVSQVYLSSQQQAKAGHTGPGHTAAPSASTACSSPGGRHTMAAASRCASHTVPRQKGNHLTPSWDLRLFFLLFNSIWQGQRGTRLSRFPCPYYTPTPWGRTGPRNLTQKPSPAQKSEIIISNLCQFHSLIQLASPVKGLEDRELETSLR